MASEADGPGAAQGAVGSTTSTAPPEAQPDSAVERPPASAQPGLESLQFDKVDVQAPGGARTCAGCARTIVEEYFELGGRSVCATCGRAFASAGSWWRAVVYGGLAALLASVVWYAIVAITDYELGLIAVFVGVFIGLAVRKGGGRRGGWKMQVLAMLLTYGAVTASKVPFIIDGFRQAARERESRKEAGEAGSGAPGSAASAEQTSK
jgi:hypothetical protein